MRKINAFYLYHLCKDGEKLLAKLYEWNLVPRVRMCPKAQCGHELKLNKVGDEGCDGWEYECPNQSWKEDEKAKGVKCGYREQFRKGTFFEKSHMSIWKTLVFLHFWVYDMSLRFISREVTIDQQTAVDWASFCREVLFDHFFDNPQKLGGVGKVVEIHDSEFGKRKYHRGRHVEGQWVHGGYEQGTGRVFMVPVEDRGSKTVIPIIQEWIEPGTTLLSNYWKVHDCLKDEEYVQLAVNHSLLFKDSAKGSMALFNQQKESTPGNLALYMFLKKCKNMKIKMTGEFFRIAAGSHSQVAAFVEELDSSDIGFEPDPLIY